MAHVPTTNINALYANTTPGTTADPAAMDAAVADLVSTINTNYDYAAGLVSASTLSRLGIINVKDYNASGDGDTTTTGSITSGLKLLTVASASTFAVGQGISVAGAGAAGATLVTIVSNISGLVITLADAASTTVAGAVVSHDDTQAFLDAIAYCKINHNALYISRGTYKITSPLVIDFSDFRMYGEGKVLSRLTFTINDDAVSGIEVYGAYNVILENFSMDNLNATKKGFGIKIGKFVSTGTRNEVVHSAFRNIKVRYFNIGIEFNSGWICNFTNEIETSHNNIGFRLGNALSSNDAVNAISCYDLVAEQNVTYNVELYMFDRVNFFGGTIEGTASTIGVKIRTGIGVGFWGTYFEELLKTMQVATGASELVQTITLDGIKHTTDIFEMDNVNKLVVRNMTKDASEVFSLTTNVQHIDIEDGCRSDSTYLTLGYYSKGKNNKQTSSPVYATQYMDATRKDTFTYWAGNDHTLRLLADPAATTLSDAVSYTGRTITSTAITGLSTNLIMDGNLATYAIKAKHLCVRQEIKYPSTLKVLQYKLVVEYLDGSAVSQVYTYRDTTLTMDVDFLNVVGKESSIIFRFDMDAIQTTLGSANFARIYRFTIIQTASTFTDGVTAGKTFEFYATQVYMSKYPIQAETDNRNYEAMKVYLNSRILETRQIIWESANGTKYVETISDAGAKVITAL